MGYRHTNYNELDDFLDVRPGNDKPHTFKEDVLAFGLLVITIVGLVILFSVI